LIIQVLDLPLTKLGYFGYTCQVAEANQLSRKVLVSSIGNPASWNSTT